MDNLVSILHSHGLNRDVRDKTLRYIQSWALAFEGKPSLSYAGQVYKTLQGEGKQSKFVLGDVTLMSPRI